MSDLEVDSAPTPSLSEPWWKPIGAIAFMLIALQVMTNKSTSGTLLDDLSRSSISAIIVFLLVITVFAWVVSLFALPLWLAWLTDARSSSQFHRYHPLRPVNLTSSRKLMDGIQKQLEIKPQALHPTSESVNAAVDSILALIMRDFVEAWHSPLVSGSPDSGSKLNTTSSKQFRAMINLTIRQSLSSLITRATLIDLPQLGVCKILPLLTSHLKLFEEAEMKWRGSGIAAEIAEGEEGDVFLAALYNSGNLHPAVGNIASPDTRLTELDHLRKVAVRAMGHILPEREAKSKGVTIVVRELIASTILKQVVDALSEPDTLNALLEEKAGAALQEQKLVVYEKHWTNRGLMWVQLKCKRLRRALHLRELRLPKERMIPRSVLLCTTLLWMTLAVQNQSWTPEEQRMSYYNSFERRKLRSLAEKGKKTRQENN
jgi:hypothetical protein